MMIAKRGLDVSSRAAKVFAMIFREDIRLLALQRAHGILRDVKDLIERNVTKNRLSAAQLKSLIQHGDE
jgi:hypothetical protein